MRKFLKAIKYGIINFPGWGTSKKIVVFESDDWGSIRMPSKNAYEFFLRKGYPVDYCIYNKFDCLETSSDLIYLFDVLDSVKSKFGAPAKFTFNNITANPDFVKIRDSNYSRYYYEPFKKTLARYNQDDVINIYRQGIDSKLVKPQFHGREHVNVNRWMGALQKGDRKLKEAFSYNMFSVALSKPNTARGDYLDSFGGAYRHEFESHKSIIRTGIDIFQTVWGFKPTSFIAPCYIWDPSLEDDLDENGIKFIQGTHVQRVPKKGLELLIEKKYHFQGQVNKNQQKYLVRNVFFEPAANPSLDWVDSAMREIQMAFMMKKPAIVSSHRVNYIGSIDANNRDKNLKLLKLFLQRIIKKWPDVEFLSTDQLGELMITSSND